MASLGAESNLEKQQCKAAKKRNISNGLNGGSIVKAHSANQWLNVNIQSMSSLFNVNILLL